MSTPDMKTLYANLPSDDLEAIISARMEGLGEAVEYAFDCGHVQNYLTLVQEALPAIETSRKDIEELLFIYAGRVEAEAKEAEAHLARTFENDEGADDA